MRFLCLLLFVTLTSLPAKAADFWLTGSSGEYGKSYQVTFEVKGGTITSYESYLEGFFYYMFWSPERLLVNDSQYSSPMKLFYADQYRVVHRYVMPRPYNGCGSTPKHYMQDCGILDYSVGVRSVYSVSGDPAYNYSISEVPEPKSWLMLIIGFGLIGCAVRSRLGTRTQVG